MNKPASGEMFYRPIFKSKAKCTEPLPFTYFLLKSTVEDENEQSLESIKGGEEIGHDNGLLVNKEQPKGPG